MLFGRTKVFVMHKIGQPTSEKQRAVLAPGGRVIVADFMLRRRQQGAHDSFFLEQWLDGWKLADLWTPRSTLMPQKQLVLTTCAFRISRPTP